MPARKATTEQIEEAKRLAADRVPRLEISRLLGIPHTTLRNNGVPTVYTKARKESRDVS